MNTTYLFKILIINIHCLKRYALFFLLLFSLVTLNGVAFATGEDISVSARLEKQTLYVGQSVKFIVVVQWQNDEKLQIDFPSPPKLNGFEMINIASAVRTIRDRGKTIYEKILSYILLPKSAGNAWISPVIIKYEEGEQKGSLSTQEIRINIHPPPKTYLPLVKKSFPAFLMLLILLVGIHTVVVSLRNKKATAEQQIPVQKTLEETALEQVRDGENLADSKEYFYLISATLREYIKRKFQIEAIVGTSSSILAALRDCGVSHDYLDRAEHILVACDAVKFAGHQPDKKKIRQVQEDFIILIKKGGTKLAPPDSDRYC